MKPFYFALAVASLAMPLMGPPVEAQQIAPLRAAKTIFVCVFGEVRKPKAYEMPANATLSSLLALAGGATNDASLSRVMVHQRSGTTQTINLHDILGKIQVDIALQDGDAVIVPRSENRVLVIGEVLHPGSYAIPEGRTLSVADALGLAGGIVKGGDTKIKLIYKQATPKTGQSATPRITEAVKLDQLLQSGDVVYVSRTKPRANPDARFPKLWLLSPNPAS